MLILPLDESVFVWRFLKSDSYLVNVFAPSHRLVLGNVRKTSNSGVFPSCIGAIGGLPSQLKRLNQLTIQHFSGACLQNKGFSSVQFSPLTSWRLGRLRNKRDIDFQQRSFSSLSAGRHRQLFAHGWGCLLFGLLVRPAFPLPTTASPT